MHHIGIGDGAYWLANTLKPFSLIKFHEQCKSHLLYALRANTQNQLVELSYCCPASSRALQITGKQAYSVL